MHLPLNIPSGSRKSLAALLLVLFISVIGVAFSMGKSDGYDSSRREVLLRRIGHEVLLQSGDSTSRVLPVKKTGNNEYHISFEDAFTFQPDSLVHTTKRLLAKDPLAGGYVVNVLSCADSSVAYGYAISGDKNEDIIACQGRVQPKACYLISIRFQPAETSKAWVVYLLGSIVLLAVVGFIFFRPFKPRSFSPENQSPVSRNPAAGSRNTSANLFALGAMLFDAETRRLMLNGKTTDLTKTETRVLSIFALTPNEVIERSRLQKEIWEDEGIIVGRSLDMFISKLRKKLEPDPTIRIAVVRGKGYRLEISSQESPGS